MNCKHPLVRYEFPNGNYTVLSYEKVKKEGIDLTHIHNKKGQIPIKETQIPCTHCIACRLNYSAIWANRILLELKNIPENQKWFLTLTYSPEKLHITQGVDPETGEIYESNTLLLEDMQLFNKRLRENCAEKITHHTCEIGEKTYDIGLRYYYCGEYGSQTDRSHYHMIIWNIRLEELGLEFYKYNEQHQPLWKCKKLDQIWDKGFVTVGGVTWESIAYTARYMLKKQKGQGAEIYYKLKGQRPEFCHMSTRPGIAREYYEEHKGEIYEYDEITIMKKKGAFKIKPFTYYDRLFDEENPEEMERIKEHRQEVGKEAMQTKLSKTTLDEISLLAVEERTLEQKVKKLKRTIE